MSSRRRARGLRRAVRAPRAPAPVTLPARECSRRARSRPRRGEPRRRAAPPLRARRAPRLVPRRRRPAPTPPTPATDALVELYATAPRARRRSPSASSRPTRSRPPRSHVEGRWTARALRARRRRHEVLGRARGPRGDARRVDARRGGRGSIATRCSRGVAASRDAWWSFLDDRDGGVGA